MRNDWVRRNPWIFVAAPVGIALVATLFGEVVMHLWNWLLPGLFGWHQITFWQALGLLLLCRMFFGSWRGGHDRSKHRCEKRNAWERMTPEEREKFRQEMRARWSRVGAPPSETSEPA